MNFTGAVLEEVHVHWAGLNGFPGGGHAQGVSSNLLKMACVTDVKNQLEMIRRRGSHDWIEVKYRVGVGAAQASRPTDDGAMEEEGMDEGRSDDRAISPFLGAKTSDRNGGPGGGGSSSGDTQMDSPPPQRPPSADDYDEMHANGYDDDNGDGNSKNHILAQPRGLSNSSRFTPGGSRHVQEDIIGDDPLVEPDSQGQIWS
ncbi:hypothetical protein PG988_000182 [Apiospora saccharicola]